MNDEQLRGMTSSERTDWRTPPQIFAALDAQYSFELDAAADDENHLCAQYFTEEMDALKQDWFGRVFLNPPYGSALPHFLRKAWEETQNGNAELVCALVTARTDTRWFHDWGLRAAEVFFVKGRIQFLRADGTPGTSNVFPSLLLVYRRMCAAGLPRFGVWERPLPSREQAA